MKDILESLITEMEARGGGIKHLEKMLELWEDDTKKLIEEMETMYDQEALVELIADGEDDLKKLIELSRAV